jgi:hypothetical protein
VSMQMSSNAEETPKLKWQHTIIKNNHVGLCADDRSL